MIKLIKSTFYNEKETKQKLVDFIEKAQFLSMNEQCKIFEENFAIKQERKFAVFVNSGSSANLLLIQALLNLGRLKKGDKVGFSALTWATNVMPLIQLGLNPVAIDCYLENLNVSSKELGNYLSEIKCFFATNVLGFAGDLPRIKELCEQKNIIFLEDNCESLGSKIEEVLSGNFGLASTFSFFVGHHLSTIEGGMVCTDDEDLYMALLQSRSHGWDRNLPKENREKLKSEYSVNDFYDKYTFYDLAFNFRPTEINGFLGNVELTYWDEIVGKREKNFKYIIPYINKNPNFISLELEHMDIVSSFAIPFICKNKQLFEMYKEKFVRAGVEIRPIIAGDITKQPFYLKYFGESRDFANCNFIHENGFYCGNNPEMSEEELNLIVELIKN